MTTFPISERYAVQFDDALDILWSIWTAASPCCFSPALLADMQYGISTIVDGSFEAADRFRYFVLRSRREDIFSLGADLAFLAETILSGNREDMLSYARRCANMLYAVHNGFGKGVTSVALVQGKCIGGGFELALSCDYLIAEHQSQFCFPEIQLGIFPGMGALQVLARRLSQCDYRNLCQTGRNFTASELASMGLVDAVVDNGQGKQYVVEWIKKRRSTLPAHQAMNTAYRSARSVSHADFQSSLTCWTDMVMSLDKRHLALLSHAIQRQREHSQ